MKEGEIELDVPSSYENLSVIRNIARAFLIAENVSENIKAQLIFAIDELATNVAEHAYVGMDKSEARLKLNMQKEDESIKIVIEDFGIGIIKDKKSKPEGGMGLQIVKKISGDFKMIEKEHGVRVEIIKNIRGGEEC